MLTRLQILCHCFSDCYGIPAICSIVTWCHSSTRRCYREYVGITVMNELLRIFEKDVGPIVDVGNGEFHGSHCPWCKNTNHDSDRFRLWPGATNRKGQVVGRYWCRQCGVKDTLVQFLRERRGISWTEAYGLTGVPAKAIGDDSTRRCDSFDQAHITAPSVKAPRPPVEPRPTDWQGITLHVGSMRAGLVSGRPKASLDYCGCMTGVSLTRPSAWQD
jgi:hypothetical protein